MSKLKVLLTGAAGHIGQTLAPPFRERYHLRTLDCRPLPGDSEAFCASLEDQASLARAMTDIDVVVHLAARAKTETPFAELVPHNLAGLYHTLEAARLAKVRRVVFASTCQTMEGYPRGRTIQVDEPPRPISLYAVSKVFGEALGRYYQDHHGLEFIAVRIGAFQPPSVVADATQRWVRDLWLSPRDCIALMERAIETPGIRYAVVFGTSITAQERFSRAPAREVLGFEPQDNVRDWLPPGPPGEPSPGY